MFRDVLKPPRWPLPQPEAYTNQPLTPLSLFGRGAGGEALLLLLCALGACVPLTTRTRTDAGADIVTDVAQDLPQVDGGACVPACSAAQTCCGGRCVSVQNDLANCGGCGLACSTEHTSAACASGACRVLRCLEDWSDCNSVAEDGCEVDIAHSTANCGACGASCGVAPRATATCADGQCGLQCMTGFADCNTLRSDGCEVDTRTSSAHCGACGRACGAVAGATPACVAGACRPMCLPGFADCDMNPSNGCEVNLNSDRTHCGACGNGCVVNTLCAGGVCESVAFLRGGTFSAGEDVLDAGTDAGTDAGGADAADVADAPAPPDPVEPRDGAPRQSGITLTDFAIDRYEVTVARFRRFWEAGHPAVPGGSAGSAPLVAYPGAGRQVPWSRTASVACAVVEPTATDLSGTSGEVGSRGIECNWSAAAGGRENHPINCVDWCTAQAYCVWANGRLPTEAEWEYAGRSVLRRSYPWGTARPNDQLCWSGPRSPMTDRAGTCPVGMFPSGATPEGVMDMLGNVSEWTADHYATYVDLRPFGRPIQCWGTVSGRFNPVCTNIDECVPSVAPCYFDNQRVTRGSAWLHDDVYSTVHLAARTERIVDSRRSIIGFRCAH